MISFLVFLISAFFFIKIARRKLSKPNFKGQTVWITGASSGIGEHLAYQFSKKNVEKLIISARNVTQLERVKNGCANPSKVEIVRMDMVDFDAVKLTTKKVITDLTEKGLKLDIVVENAGICMRSDFLNFSFENHLALTDLNVHGPYNHIQSFLPHMISNKSGQIVVTGSILGRYSNANRSSYVASKFAVHSMMDSLRSELWSHNITVTTIAPGYIQSKVGPNALVSKAGELCGEMDSCYHLGMNTDDFAKETIKAIYMK